MYNMYIFTMQYCIILRVCMYIYYVLQFEFAPACQKHPVATFIICYFCGAFPLSICIYRVYFQFEFGSACQGYPAHVARSVAAAARPSWGRSTPGSPGRPGPRWPSQIRKWRNGLYNYGLMLIKKHLKIVIFFSNQIINLDIISKWDVCRGIWSDYLKL